MKVGFTEAELRAAYDICVLMKEHTGNVLATTGFEGSKPDQDWNKKATKFIEAYETVNANKLAKDGKADKTRDFGGKFKSTEKKTLEK
jgi:hypothetical protein